MVKESFNNNWWFAKQSKKFMGTPEDEFVPVTLPHDAMIHRKKTRYAEGRNNSGYYPTGSYEYKKKFFVPKQWENKQIALEFEGVYRNAMVYMNGVFIGKNVNGYTPFCLELNGFLEYEKENEIMVIARNGNDSRWYTGAGIYRSVNLLIGGQVYIVPNSVRITTETLVSERAIILYEAEVNNNTAFTHKLQLEVSIWDNKNMIIQESNGCITLLPGERGKIRQRISIINPLLWDIEHPFLYRFKSIIKDQQDLKVMDRYETLFGIRTLNLDPQKGLLLNGKTVKLRGGCIHHDNGIVGAATFKSAEDRRVRILKESGFNAIRASHNPVSPAFLEACDKYGMLVMDEAFDTWEMCKNPHDYALAFDENWEKDLEAMVKKDYNHPCVILYSIGNEIQELGNHRGAAMARKLAEKLRILDSTRYTIQAINLLMSTIGANKTWFFNQNELDVNQAMSEMADDRTRIMSLKELGEIAEEASEATDIVGYNYATTRVPKDHKKYPDRVFCGTETFAEDIAKNWKLVKDYSCLVGDFCWTAWDYIGECGIGKIDYSPDASQEYGDYPWVLAYCGDIDLIGTRRAQSYFRETVFGKSTHPYILTQNPENYGKIPVKTPWSFSDYLPTWNWRGCEGKQIAINVYSSGDEVELFINKRSVGRKPSGEKTGYITEFKTVYETGTVKAISYCDGRIESTQEIQSGSGNIDLIMKADYENISFENEDLCYITILCVDDEGCVVPNQDQEIFISVEGVGVLQGLGNACPYNQDNFFDCHTRTWNGRALLAVRPTGTGEIVVTVKYGNKMKQNRITVTTSERETES